VETFEVVGDQHLERLCVRFGFAVIHILAFGYSQEDFEKLKPCEQFGLRRLLRDVGKSRNEDEIDLSEA
jgi:hypothetical protein